MKKNKRKKWSLEEEQMIQNSLLSYEGFRSHNSLATKLERAFKKRSFNSVLSKVRRTAIKLGIWENVAKSRRDKREHVIKKFLYEQD